MKEGEVGVALLGARGFEEEVHRSAGPESPKASRVPYNRSPGHTTPAPAAGPDTASQP